MKKVFTKKNILIISKVLITTLFFIFILNKVDLDSTITLLRKTNTTFFFLALAIMTIEVLIANVRWKVILNQLEIKIPFLLALRYLWVGVFFNQALPSSVGGDAVRAYYLCKHEDYSIGLATIGVLLDRVVGMFGLVILIIATTPLLFGLVVDPVVKWTIVAVMIGALSAISISMVLDLIPNKLSNWKIVQGLSTFSFKGRKIIFSYHGLVSILLSLVIHLIFIFAVWLLAIAMGLNISLFGMLLVVPITNLLIALPISIAGWGVREGVMIAGLGYLNVSAEAAFALSILYGILMLVVSLPGLFAWIWQLQR